MSLPSTPTSHDAAMLRDYWQRLVRAVASAEGRDRLTVEIDRFQQDANADIQEEKQDVSDAQQNLKEEQAKFDATQARDQFAAQVDQQLAAADKKIEELEKQKDNAADDAAKGHADLRRIAPARAGRRLPQMVGTSRRALKVPSRR